MCLTQKISKFIEGEGPLTVAVSGGGDSMALLGLIVACAQGRDVHALIVDHGLRATSGAEAARVAAWCYALGAQPHVLNWAPPALGSAVQEQARLARYGLLGQTCRALGSTRLFVGHTQDDQAETYVMREQNGASWRGLCAMADITYAPVWPQLYGVSLVRPLLGTSRQDLRAYNSAHDVPWLEDPSNDNTDFQRVRARHHLAASPTERQRVLDALYGNRERREAELLTARTLVDSVTWHENGTASFSPKLLDEEAANVILGRLLACVGGATYLPDMQKVERLTAQMRAQGFKSAGLAGATVSLWRREFWLFPEPPRGREPAMNVSLTKGASIIVANRYLCQAATEGLSVKPFWPARGQLPQTYEQSLKVMPALARRSLLGVFAGNELLAAAQLGYAPNTILSIWKGLSSARFLQI